MKRGTNVKKRLTKAEEEIMQALWSIEHGRIQELLPALGEPRPARTTVSTLLSILENKGFVEHTQSGRKHIYFPVVSKSEYTKIQLHSLIKNYFNGSFASMVSFFAAENNISLDQLDEIINQTKNKKE